jgi:hypothetical protein
MNQFKIEDSFAIEPDLFVFAGSLVEGEAHRDMTIQVPEAGHKLTFTIRAVEFMHKAGGRELMALVVNNTTPGYLRGLGAGWTAELHEKV